jgi:hypothetical protein
LDHPSITPQAVAGPEWFSRPGRVNLRINVTYAVRGANDGVTDDTAAIMSKIEDALMGIPGAVILEDDHLINGTIVTQPNIPLIGRGAGATRLQSGGANVPGIRLPGGSHYEIGGFTLAGRGAGTGFNSQHGVTGNDVSNVLLHDLDVEDWPARGVFFSQVDNLYAERIEIRRITESAVGLGGIGFWVFDTSQNLFLRSILTEDVDASGIQLDSSSPPLGGGKPQNWHMSEIITRRTSRVRHSAAISYEGASDGTLIGAVIEDTGTEATLGIGLLFGADQMGAEANDIVVANVSMRDISGAAVHLRGTKRNSLSDFRVHNVQRDLIAGDGQGFDVRAYTDLSGMVHEASDNFTENVRVTQDPGIGLYKYGVLYHGAGTQRNIGRNNNWGTPSVAVVGYVSGASSSGLLGTAAGVDNGNTAGVRRQGQASISNTAPANRIYHALGTMPHYWQVQATVSGHLATATATTSYLEVSLQDNTGAAVTTAETVVWEVEA